MKQVTLNDLIYKKPEIKSLKGLRDLESLKKVDDDNQRSKLWQQWLQTYWKEKQEFDSVCNDNYSNFCWLLTYLGTSKDEIAKKGLKTYAYRPGFFVKDDYVFEARTTKTTDAFDIYQALAYVEKKEMVAL